MTCRMLMRLDLQESRTKTIEARQAALRASRAQSDRKSYAQAVKDGPYIAPSFSNFITKTIIPATSILTSVEPIDSIFRLYCHFQWINF